MTLWEWAGAAWTRPDVAAACLSLQNAHGQCIPLLLWALWRWSDSDGPDDLTAERGVALCRAAEDTVLTSLRAERRDAVSPDRGRLLAIELEAEHELIDRLERIPGNGTDVGLASVLVPLREEVAARPTDEASRRPVSVETCGGSPGCEIARPLIRPPAGATFSRKGRRKMLSNLSAFWGQPLKPNAFDDLLDALSITEPADAR